MVSKTRGKFKGRTKRELKKSGALDAAKLRAKKLALREASIKRMGGADRDAYVARKEAEAMQQIETTKQLDTELWYINPRLFVDTVMYRVHMMRQHIARQESSASDAELYACTACKHRFRISALAGILCTMENPDDDIPCPVCMSPDGWVVQRDVGRSRAVHQSMGDRFTQLCRESHLDDVLKQLSHVTLGANRPEDHINARQISVFSQTIDRRTGELVTQQSEHQRQRGMAATGIRASAGRLGEIKAVSIRGDRGMPSSFAGLTSNVDGAAAAAAPGKHPRTAGPAGAAAQKKSRTAKETFVENMAKLYAWAYDLPPEPPAAVPGTNSTAAAAAAPPPIATAMAATLGTATLVSQDAALASVEPEAPAAGDSGSEDWE